MKKPTTYLFAAVFSSVLLTFACISTTPQEDEDREPTRAPTSVPTETPTSVPPDEEPADGPEPEEEITLENWTPWFIPPFYLQMFGTPPCDASPPGGISLPGVVGLTSRGKYASLCLYGLDLQVPFLVRLYSPDNTPMAEGFFSAYQQGDEWILEQMTPPLSGTEKPGSILWDSPAKRIQIPLYLPAGAPAGQWRIQVESGGSILEGSMVLGEERFATISNLPLGDQNLFQSTFGTTYAPNDQFLLAMSNFDPVQAQVVDIYFKPGMELKGSDASSGQAIWVNSVEFIPDENGFYRVQLPTDPAGPGTYILIVRSGEQQDQTPQTSCLLPWITCYQVGNGGSQGNQPSCQGFSFGGFCWYLGEETTSCQAVCSAHGGINQATFSFTGSQGSPQSCQEVLTGMGLTLDDFYETSQGGIGCFAIRSASGNFLGYWDRVETTMDATYPGRHRVCACQE